MKVDNKDRIGRCFREDGYLLLLMSIVSMSFALCLSYSTSPLYFHDGYDSAVFQSMGLAILQGKIPYVDLFDHKGPILYFINAFGLWLGSGKIGIFILQIIANTVSFVSIYKIIRLFHGTKSTIVMFLGVLLAYAYFYGEGNLCEEWMLCLVSSALYLSLRNIIHQPDNKRMLVDSAFYGFCLAMCFLIRPNDAVIHIGGLMFGTCLWLIVNKQYQKTWQNVLNMGVSFVVFALPVIIFYAWHSALPDMWYGLITYNTQYAAGNSLLSSVVSLPKLLIFVPLLLVACVIAYKKNHALLYIFIPQILLAWMLLGGRLYRHYWICLLPLFSLFGTAGLYYKKISVGIVSVGLCVILLLSAFKPIVLTSAYHKAKGIAQTYVYKQTMVNDFYAESEKLFSYVPVNEQNQIWNYNLGWQIKPYFSVFYHHGIVQCNRVPFYPMALEDVKLRASDDIKTHTPLWLMLSRDKEGAFWLVDAWQEQDYEYIIDNYEFIAATNPEICEIELWKKKNIFE